MSGSEHPSRKLGRPGRIEGKTQKEMVLKVCRIYSAMEEVSPLGPFSNMYLHCYIPLLFKCNIQVKNFVIGSCGNLTSFSDCKMKITVEEFDLLTYVSHTYVFSENIFYQ